MSPVEDDLVLVERPAHGLGCYVPAWQARAEDALVAGAEALLAKHAAFLQWLADHGEAAA